MGLLDSLKKLFNGGNEEELNNLPENKTEEKAVLEIDEEDRLVVALAASIMAGKDKPNSHFHISSITRVK